MSARPKSASAPWAGLAAPPLVWFLYQQGLGAAVMTACRTGGAPIGPSLGLLALLACAAAAWSARRAATQPPEGARAEARRLLGWLAIAGAVLFGLAVAYQMLATFLVPPCVR